MTTKRPRELQLPGSQFLRGPSSPLALTRLDEFDMAYAEGLSQLVKGNDGWIPPTVFQAADILLAEAGNIRKLFLGQSLHLPYPTDVFTDNSAHIHALICAGLHIISLSTILCIALTGFWCDGRAIKLRHRHIERIIHFESSTNHV